MTLSCEAETWTMGIHGVGYPIGSNSSPFGRGFSQNCHSEERSDEESGAGLPRVNVNPPPQTARFAWGDTLRAAFEVKLLGRGFS